MANFANGFQGDINSLNVILPTLNAKTYIIPGVTVNGDLNVTSMGEQAYFYVQNAPNVGANHKLGGKLSEQTAGVTRIAVDLSEGYGIHTVLPHVNFATVQASVVESKVVQETLKRANLFNEEFVEALVAGAQTKTYKKGAKGTAALLDAIGTFKKDNKGNALKPTGALVTVDFYNELIEDVKNRSTERTDGLLFDGNVLTIAGIPVIESVDLTGSDFILIHAEGVGAIINVQSLFVVDSTTAGYPGGLLISGELGRGFEVVDKVKQPVLGATGYHVAKFSEAA